MNTDQSAAALGARLGARVIDGLVVGVVSVVAEVLLLLTDHVVLSTLGWLLLLAAIALGFYNQVVRVGLRGQSLGKEWLGVRVVDLRTQEPIGIGRALLRDFVLALLAAACLVPAIVNVIVAARNPRGRGWHDEAAGSWVCSAGAATTSPASTSPPAPSPDPAPPRRSLATETPAHGSVPSSPPYVPTSPPVTPPTAPPAGMVAPPPGVTPPPPAPAAAPVESAPPAEPDEPISAQTRLVDRAQHLPTWSLTTALGDSCALDGLLLVGRDPDASLVDGASTWAVDDPDLTTSKTHALLGIEGGEPWVEDWHSTNGVLLRRGDEETLVEVHTRTPLRAGDVIELGEFPVTVVRGA